MITGLVTWMLLLGSSDYVCPTGSTARALLCRCEAPEEALFYRGSCAGYIQAAWDAHAYLRDLMKEKEMPEGVSLEQIHDLVVTYLRAHPEDLDRWSMGFVWDALVEEWPLE